MHMSTPQQPELHRSRETREMDLDNVEGNLRAHERPGSPGGGLAPVPEDNRPGHHPDTEQDKPDMDDFIARASGGTSTERPSSSTVPAHAARQAAADRLRTAAGQAAGATLTGMAAAARFAAGLLEAAGRRVSPDR